MKKKKEKIIRQKDSPDKEIRRMLEFYTLVPPSPATIKGKENPLTKKYQKHDKPQKRIFLPDERKE